MAAKFSRFYLLVLSAIVSICNASALEQEVTSPLPGVEVASGQGDTESASQAALAPSSVAGSSSADPLWHPARLQSFVDGVVTASMDDHNVAGAAVAIVTSDEILMLKGYGFANADTGEKVEPEKHLFRVASISKLFTAVAIMQLVEAGKVDLNADIRTYLGDMAFDDRMGTITVANLLSHTPGFDERIFGYFGENADLIGLPTEDQLNALAMPQVRKPGKTVAYSNYGFSLLGEIIAQVSGKPYAEYIHDDLLPAVGMGRSSMRVRFDPSFDDPKQRAELLPAGVKPHIWRAGRYETVTFPMPIRAVAPEGGLWATAADMGKFAQAFLRDGAGENGQVLTAETMDQLKSVLHTDFPGVNANAHGFWMSSIAGHTAYEHSGFIADFHSNLVMIPSLDIGIFVSTNTSSGGYLSSSLATRIVEQYVSKPEVFVPEPNVEFLERAQDYVGTYLSTRRPTKGPAKFTTLARGMLTISVDEEGYLRVGRSGQRYVETAPGEFLAVDGEKRIRFERPAEGPANLAFLSDSPSNQFERATFWETKGSLVVPILAAGLVMLVYLGKLVLWLVVGKRRDSASEIISGGWVVLTATLLWALTYGVGVKVVMKMAGDPHFFYQAYPFPLIPLLHGLLIVSSIATLMALYKGGRMLLSDGPLGFFGKVQYTATLMAYIILIVALWQWNIFPALF